jgi:hypothetical protein
MKQPTVRAAKTALRKAIMAWGDPDASGMGYWREIERKIVALDQAVRREVHEISKGLEDVW